MDGATLCQWGSGVPDDNAGLGARCAVRPLAPEEERAGLDVKLIAWKQFSSLVVTLKPFSAWRICSIHVLEHACPVRASKACTTGTESDSSWVIHHMVKCAKLS